MNNIDTLRLQRAFSAGFKKGGFMRRVIYDIGFKTKHEYGFFNAKRSNTKK